MSANNGHWTPTEATKAAAKKFAMRHGLCCREVAEHGDDALTSCEMTLGREHGESQHAAGRRRQIAALWRRVKARNQATETR